MARYTYQCPTDGNFDVHAPMAETTRTAHCPVCYELSPKYIGRMNVAYPYGGRAAFKDGPEGDGHTVRETTEKWVEGWEASGTPYEPSGTRWV